MKKGGHGGPPLQLLQDKNLQHVVKLCYISENLDSRTRFSFVNAD